MCDLHKCLNGTDKCDCQPPFKLLTFPTEKKNPDARKEWIRLVNRTDTKTRKIWEPKRWHRICSVHFVHGQPTPEHPYPTQLLGYSQHTKQPKGRREIFKHPLAATVTVKKPPPQQDTDIPVYTASPVKRRRTDTNLPTDHHYASPLHCDCVNEHCMGCHAKLQELGEKTQRLKKLERHLELQKASCDSLLTDDASVRFFTGLPTKAVYELLWEYVEPKVKDMNYWRGTKGCPGVPAGTPVKRLGRHRKSRQKDELLMTLMKLRLDLLHRDLSRRFRLSESTVSSVFCTWIKVLASVLKPTIKKCLHLNAYVPISLLPFAGIRICGVFWTGQKSL